MDAGTLDKLHYARHKDVGAVADGVHLQLLARDIFIDQHGLILVYLNGGAQVTAQLPLIGNYLHRPAAQDEGRTHEHGVAYLGCGGNAVLYLCHRPALGLRDIKLTEHLFKKVAVLGSVDGVAIGADYPHPPVSEALRQIDRRLTAERRYDAYRLLKVDYIHHVLGAKRLEIQLIGAGVVRRNGLGVIIDYYCLIARLLNR